MSKIEWTDHTVNPLTGCRKISSGCEHCYAESMARRLKGMGRKAYQTVVDEHGWTGKVGCQLDQIRHIPGRGKMVFVGSMTDLFLPDHRRYDLDAVFGAMLAQRQHTFQVLTKRPRCMAAYFDGVQDSHAFCGEPTPFPAANIWLGVTVEDNAWKGRIDILRSIPAALRFVSLEPLLGYVDVTEHLGPHSSHDSQRSDWIDWVIVGAETGPTRRYCETRWVRDLVCQCYDYGVPVFVKALHDPPRRKGGQPVLIPATDIDTIRERMFMRTGDWRQWPKQKQKDCSKE